MTTAGDRTTNASDEHATSVLRHGLWDGEDVAAFLGLGKSAANLVMAAPDFPAPAVGNRRYRRYVPEEILAWARERAARRAAERRGPRASSW